MNKRFKTVAIAAISSIALAGSIAFAQTATPDQSNQQGTRTERRGGGKHRGHRCGGMRRGGGFFGQLNLTDDQKAKMKQIRQSFAEQNKPLREQLRAKRQELRQAQRRRYVQRSTGYSETDGNGEPRGEVDGRAPQASPGNAFRFDC